MTTMSEPSKIIITRHDEHCIDYEFHGDPESILDSLAYTAARVVQLSYDEDSQTDALALFAIAAIGWLETLNSKKEGDDDGTE